MNNTKRVSGFVEWFLTATIMQGRALSDKSDRYKELPKNMETSAIILTLCFLSV